MLKKILGGEVWDKAIGKYEKLKEVREEKEVLGCRARSQANKLKKKSLAENRKESKGSGVMRASWSHIGHRWGSGAAVLTPSAR